MNEQQLIYFKKLAENQNLSQTAQELIISPPALSATMRRLEEELGCRLFDRTGRNIVLSECGQILLRHTKEALSALDAAREEIASAQQHSDTHLTVGLTSPLACQDALQAFIQQYPEFQLTHRVLRTNQLSSPSLRQEVHFIIASKDDVPSRDWDGTLIKASNPLVLTVYPTHPLAKRESVHLKELEGERFIAIPRDYCFRNFMDKVFKDAGISPKIVLECEFAMRPAMLDAQYGVLLATAAVKNTGFSANTAYIPVTQPRIDYPWYIFRNRKPLQSKAATQFFEFMVSFYNQNG